MESTRRSSIGSCVISWATKHLINGVERTGARRFAPGQIQRHRRLAPVADPFVKRHGPTTNIESSSLLEDLRHRHGRGLVDLCSHLLCWQSYSTLEFIHVLSLQLWIVYLLAFCSLPDVFDFFFTCVIFARKFDVPFDFAGRLVGSAHFLMVKAKETVAPVCCSQEQGFLTQSPTELILSLDRKCPTPSRIIGANESEFENNPLRSAARPRPGAGNWPRSQWTGQWTGKTRILTNVCRQVDGWTGAMGSKGGRVDSSPDRREVPMRYRESEPNRPWPETTPYDHRQIPATTAKSRKAADSGFLFFGTFWYSLVIFSTLNPTSPSDPESSTPKPQHIFFFR